MSTLTTSKRIDASALTVTLGAPVSTVENADGTIVSADVDEATLQAALDAHEAPVQPAAVAVEDRIAVLEAEVRGMKERASVEAAKASPTAKGVAQAVAAGGA